MRARNTIRQLLRTPVRTMLFIVLLTLISTFLCLGGGLWVTAQRSIADAEDNFTTIAVPDLAALRDLAGIQEVPYFYSLEVMSRCYAEQKEAQSRFHELLRETQQIGLASTIAWPDSRQKMMAYAQGGLRSSSRKYGNHSQSALP